MGITFPVAAQHPFLKGTPPVERAKIRYNKGIYEWDTFWFIAGIRHGFFEVFTLKNVDL